MLVSFLLLSVQSPRVTISLSPMPAPAAIRAFSTACGRRLAVTPALADEVLFLRLKDASVEGALSHIAEVLCAKWVRHSNGTSWLEPNPEAQKNIENANAAEDAHRLSNSLKYLQNRLSQQPEQLDKKAVDAYVQKKLAQDQRMSDAEARKNYSRVVIGAPANQGSPAWRAMARLVLQIDPKVLLAIPADGREVWAENPTPMQHGFSETQKAALQIYRQELGILDSSLEANRVKLVCRKVTLAEEFVAEFGVTGPDGKAVDRSVGRLNSYANQIEPPSSEADAKASKPGEIPLQPTAEVVEARKALSLFYEGADRKAIYAKWRPKLLDPVHFEPTTWDLGEELMMVAESLDRNLVGTVNDASAASWDLLTNLTATQVLSKNRESLIPTDDDWLVFRSHEQKHRISRSKARALLANCVRHGGMTVDLAAEWAAQSSDPYAFQNWLCNYVCLLGTSGGLYSDLSTIMNDYALRLWAAIGSSGIEHLRNGGVVQLSRLSPAAKAQISTMLYDDELQDGRDPTDALPNGIIDGTLKMSIEELPVMYAWASADGPPVAPVGLEAKEFGTLLAKGEPWKQVPPSAYQRYDRFRVGVVRKYKLNLLLEPGDIPMTVSLPETLFNPASKELSELPPAFKSEVEKARLAALAKPVEVPKQRVIPPR